MKITEYTNYYSQPLHGLIIGLIIVVLSGYYYLKIDKKIKAELSLAIENRSASYPVGKTVASLGIASGGIMIIVAIKFLSS